MDGEWEYQRVCQGALGSEPFRTCTVSFLPFAVAVADDASL